jgi:hypothetical protein
VFGARRLSSESHEDRAFESNCSKAAKAVVSNGRRLLSFNEGEPIETYWAKAESSGAELRYLSDRVLFEAEGTLVNIAQRTKTAPSSRVARKQVKRPRRVHKALLLGRFGPWAESRNDSTICWRTSQPSPSQAGRREPNLRSTLVRLIFGFFAQPSMSAA